MNGEVRDRHHELQQRALRLLQATTVLHRNARTHSLNNEALAAPLQNFRDVIAEIVGTYTYCEFLISGTLCVLNGTIASPDLSMLGMVRDVSNDLKAKAVGGFRMRTVPTLAQARVLTEAIMAGRTGMDGGQSVEILHAMEIDSLLQTLHAQELETIANRDPIKQAIDLYTSLFQIIQRSVSAVRDGGEAHTALVTSKTLRELLDAGVRIPNVLVELALLRDRRIPYLQRHLVSTTVLATLVGIELRLPRSELLHIADVALFHELGFVAYGEHLERAGKDLSPADRQLVKDLPLLSARLFLRRKGLDFSSLRSVVGAVECKRSYDEPLTPDDRGLSGQFTTLAARVVQVCSTFDALTSDRSFRAAMPVPKALEQLKGGNTRLDPRIVIALVNVLMNPSRLVGRSLEKSLVGPRTAAHS